MKYQKIKELKRKYNEDELWNEYQNNKTSENRNKLIEHYLYLLYKPVKNIYPMCRSQNEMEDIFQSGVIGLIEAVDYYSKDKNTSFKTFSRWRIHGSIIDYLRKTGLISLPYNVRKKLNHEKETAENENLNFENPYQITSIDALEESYEGSGFIDSLRTDMDNLTENIVEEKILFEKVLEILKKMQFDEYVTIIYYYFYNRTLDDIANKLKMTRSGVWQIKNRALTTLRESI